MRINIIVGRNILIINWLAQGTKTSLSGKRVGVAKWEVQGSRPNYSLCSKKKKKEQKKKKEKEDPIRLC